MISQIGQRATKFSTNIMPHKTKVEKLVSLRGLLEKVEYLFELPARLHKAWEMGNFRQAVNVYQKAKKITKNHKAVAEIKSFQQILEESESIMSQMTTMLKSNVLFLIFYFPIYSAKRCKNGLYFAFGKRSATVRSWSRP